MKAQIYTMDEIFEKKLLFLIPFHIFCYEKQFREYENNSEKLQELKNEYVRIKARLEEICLAGEINEYEKCTIVDMSKKVIDNIAAKYEKVREGVRSIMGGKVLEYEAKSILQRGIREGIREGKLEGIREGKLEGIREGKVEGRLEVCIDLIKDGLLSIAEAAKRLNMKEEDLKKYL